MLIVLAEDSRMRTVGTGADGRLRWEWIASPRQEQRTAGQDLPGFDRCRGECALAGTAKPAVMLPAPDRS